MHGGSVISTLNSFVQSHSDEKSVQSHAHCWTSSELSCSKQRSQRWQRNPMRLLSAVQAQQQPLAYTTASLRHQQHECVYFQVYLLKTKINQQHTPRKASQLLQQHHPPLTQLFSPNGTRRAARQMHQIYNAIFLETGLLQQLLITSSDSSYNTTPMNLHNATHHEA
jgi:hypothetical protein